MAREVILRDSDGDELRLARPDSSTLVEVSRRAGKDGSPWSQHVGVERDVLARSLAALFPEDSTETTTIHSRTGELL